MRILHFINGIHPGGKERRLLELLKSLVAEPATEVELAVMAQEIRYPEVAQLGIPIHFLIRKVKKDPTVFWSFYLLCRKIRPQVIHTWDPMTALYAAPVARLLKIIFVNGMINEAPEKPLPLQTRLWSRISFPLSDVVVANSLAGLASYEAPADRSVCVYNGFDRRRFESLEPSGKVRASLGIGSEQVVGMVGEFARRKDFATFIRAAQIVLRQRENVIFLAVGDGPTLEESKALVLPEYKGRIMFTGWRSDVEPIVSIMDISVLATYTEGISNSILEYMVLGKPVIATDGGGTKELVMDGVTGFLVGQKDVDGIVRRVLQLLDNPAQARTMGELGRQRAYDHFTIEKMTAQYLALYHRLRERHGL